MSLTIINGANILARNVIRKLAPVYEHLRICDYRPYRESLYGLCKELEGEKAKIEKVMVTNTPSLERAIEGSQKVLYFTHDYFTLAPDKNLMLQAVGQLTRKLKVEKTICVCPIEFDHYSGQKIDPFEMKQIAENHALGENPEMTLLLTNLLYGEQSYVLRFLTQQMLTGRVIHPRIPCNTQNYYPIHIDDAVSCIVDSLQNGQIKGLEYALRGSTSITFEGIVDLIAKHCNQPDYKKCRRSYITGFIEKFFVGRTHDKNMMKMFQWHEVNRQNYMNDWNYMQRFKIQESHTLKETYAEGKVDSNKYVTPYLHQYKHIALE